MFLSTHKGSVFMHIIAIFGMLLGEVAGAAGWEISVNPEPNPPNTGWQYFTVQVSPNDKAVDDGASVQRKVKDIQLSMVAIMPAMPNHPTMRSAGRVEKVKEDTFKSRVTLSMGGVWFIHVTLVDVAQTSDFFYRLETGKKGLERVESIPEKMAAPARGGHHHHK